MAHSYSAHCTAPLGVSEKSWPTLWNALKLGSHISAKSLMLGMAALKQAQVQLTAVIIFNRRCKRENPCPEGFVHPKCARSKFINSVIMIILILLHVVRGRWEMRPYTIVIGARVLCKISFAQRVYERNACEKAAVTAEPTWENNSDAACGERLCDR